MNKTTLQSLRISRNLSQSQLAKLSGVNLRTLQDFEQGRKPLKNAKGEMLYRLSIALGCTVNDMLSDSFTEIEITAAHSVSHLEQYYNSLSSYSLYDKYYTFPVIVPESAVEMNRVYPTMQQTVYKLHTELCPDRRITAVMLFGSSVTMQCNNDSDIDLAIRLDLGFTDNDTKNDISEVVQEICKWNADIIWYDRISRSDRVYHEICKGVQIL